MNVYVDDCSATIPHMIQIWTALEHTAGNLAPMPDEVMDHITGAIGDIRREIIGAPATNRAEALAKLHFVATLLSDEQNDMGVHLDELRLVAEDLDRVNALEREACGLGAAA
ncbi:hypothetical protein [Nitratireductor sp. GCM10026969]|uniref:hypothetical protein n=1 Tax=Nitratireductor sp. GCM10026969 TaxID=3252645 RepID=UPI0036190430